MSLSRPLTGCATALTFVLGTGSAALAAPNSDSFFTMPNLATGIIRTFVPTLRSFADIRYGSLEVTGSGKGIVMRDLHVTDIYGLDNCTVTIRELNIPSLALFPSEVTNSGLEASDVNFGTACLGRQGMMAAAMLGRETITLSDLSLQARQVTGSGETRFSFHLTSPEVAHIQGNADLAYFSFTMSPPGLELGDADHGEWPPTGFEAQDPLPPTPPFGVRGTLRGADVTVENLGLWQRIQPMLPMDVTVPGAFDVLVSAPEGSVQRGFQQETAQSLTAFSANPENAVLSVEIRPPSPVPFNSHQLQTPEDIVATFAPRVQNRLPGPTVELISDPSDSPNPRDVGIALAKGEGVPRNSKRALELLEPWANESDIALILAELLQQSAPDQAYRHALNAAQQGASAAPSMLDRLEADLPLETWAKLQPAANSALPEQAFASVPALRALAYAYAEGAGQPRSYALAWRLASLAAATGDNEARFLQERLDNRFAGDATWAEMRDIAADQALKDWVDQNLAQRFSPK